MIVGKQSSVYVFVQCRTLDQGWSSAELCKTLWSAIWNNVAELTVLTPCESATSAFSPMDHERVTNTLTQVSSTDGGHGQLCPAGLVPHSSSDLTSSVCHIQNVIVYGCHDWEALPRTKSYTGSRTCDKNTSWWHHLRAVKYWKPPKCQSTRLPWTFRQTRENCTAVQMKGL